MFIDIIAGARPNFVKIAAIIHAFRELPEIRLGYRIVHTGQHYDKRMSGDFFEQLEIPEPDVNLEVGSGTQAEQTAKIMIRYEELIMKQPPSATLVVGDVTSTMACAIVAQKQCVPVAHVEAGIRSGDWTMPEEINRLVTDSITNWFFTTSEYANAELRRTGIPQDRIFFVGNTMIDTLLRNRHKFKKPDFFSMLELDSPRPASAKSNEIANFGSPRPASAKSDRVSSLDSPRPASGKSDGVTNFGSPRPASGRGAGGEGSDNRANPRSYLLLTLHRPSNVDNAEQLNEILTEIAAGAKHTPIVFPVHPRTRQKLESFGTKLAEPFVVVEPLPYLEFGYLIEHAQGVITDSGGITEEATVLGIPCMTLRNSTERPETVEMGTNELIGSNPKAIQPALNRLLGGGWKAGRVPPLWDGQTGKRIVTQIQQLLLG
jgi:UDP-N-acetylglucosamine 2-epimerase (non-hydrolysing)